MPINARRRFSVEKLRVEQLNARLKVSVTGRQHFRSASTGLPQVPSIAVARIFSGGALFS